MRISLTKAGRRFNREWIFRNVNYQFEKGRSYAITGSNGSGKSTLLQVIAGVLATSEGNVEYTHNESQVSPENFYQQLSLCAPYLELIEEMTAIEFLAFHNDFKPFRQGMDPFAILEETGLGKSAHKQIRYFSSGMKQRMKLAQAIFVDLPVLLLDEPCTNLDEAGIVQYQRWIRQFAADKLIIVSSNDPQEYNFCTASLIMSDWKS
jgi:ABC-type multidrug transport system ATPase subunit